VDDSGTTWGTAWGDYDYDGDLDLVTASAVHHLYRNDGSSFTDVASSANVSGSAGVSPGWADYDNDHDLDLYMSKPGFANELFRSNGDGTFTEVGAAAGVNDGNVASQEMAWGDYDNDGFIDLYVTTGSSNANRLYP